MHLRAALSVPILLASPIVRADEVDDDKPVVEWRYDRGIVASTPDNEFRLKLSFRTQFRAESVRPTEGDSEISTHFSVPRSRLTIDGNAFGEGNRLKVEMAFSDAGGFGFVRDMWFDKRLGQHKIWIRAGQWRRPFNRQELVSDFGSELNERAITAAFVGGGRDLGVGIHNDYDKSPRGLEWVVGVFNGFSGGGDRPIESTTCVQDAATGAITCVNGVPTNVPKDFSPALVARIGYNAGDVKGYTEGDFEGGPLRWGVGLSYKVDLANFERRDLDGDDRKEPYSQNLSYAIEADAMIKIAGFGLQLGAYAIRESPRLDPRITNIELEYGVLVQPGYFVIPKHAQIAARFAYSPDRPGGRDEIEARAGFTWYWHGHDWKLATDVGVQQFTEDDPLTMKADKPDVQVRSTLQLAM